MSYIGETTAIMKNLIYTGIILVVAFLISCNDDDPEVFQFDQEFVIGQEETVFLSENNDSIRIEVQVIDITDSRCPANANCVRFGEAEVKLSVTGKEDIANIIDLCLGDCPTYNRGFLESDTVEVTIDDRNYAVILLNVTPYPFTTNETVSKQAHLKMVSV